MQSSVEPTLLALTQKLLDSIARGDWDAYSSLCDPALTCFEPEAKGHLVEGMSFHKFYFDLAKQGRPSGVPPNTTISSPKATLLGGGTVGIVAYIRLIQKVDEGGKPITVAFEETRVWQKTADGAWLHVHFHRS